MPEERTTSVWRLGKALHTYCDGIVSEQLPERWVDLINYLNEKEEAGHSLEPPRRDQSRQAK
jgi:hypothetical protein